MDDPKRKAGYRDYTGNPFPWKPTLIYGSVVVVMLVIGLKYLAPPLALLIYNATHPSSNGPQAGEDLSDIPDVIGGEHCTVKFVYSEPITRDKRDYPPPTFEKPYMLVTFTTLLVDMVKDYALFEADLSKIKGVRRNGVWKGDFSLAFQKSDEARWRNEIWPRVRSVLKKHIPEPRPPKQ